MRTEVTKSVLARGAALLSAALLTACATIRVGADFDRGTNFQAYATYDWASHDALPTGDPRLDNNQLFDARMREAVNEQLASKGLRRSASSPDLLVHYHASVRDRIDVVRMDESRGYSVGERSESYVYEEGTLLVDVVQAQSKKLLWRGWAQTELSTLLTAPETMAARLKDVAWRMFRQFPRSAPIEPVVAMPPA
jgi:uncharacterized protein DUF4136